MVSQPLFFKIIYNYIENSVKMTLKAKKIQDFLASINYFLYFCHRI